MSPVFTEDPAELLFREDAERLGYLGAQWSDPFWKNVAWSPEGCWEWTADRTADGYGEVIHNDMTASAHEAAWELINGSIPVGEPIIQTCANPPCCRPDHLVVGPLTGAAPAVSPAAKLTDDEIAEVRWKLKRGKTVDGLATEYGVQWYVISDIRNDRAWRAPGTAGLYSYFRERGMVPPEHLRRAVRKHEMNNWDADRISG
jgi:hypothetical protein